MVLYDEWLCELLSKKLSFDLFINLFIVDGIYLWLHIVIGGAFPSLLILLNYPLLFFYLFPKKFYIVFDLFQILSNYVAKLFFQLLSFRISANLMGLIDDNLIIL